MNRLTTSTCRGTCPLSGNATRCRHPPDDSAGRHVYPPELACTRPREALAAIAATDGQKPGGRRGSREHGRQRPPRFSLGFATDGSRHVTLEAATTLAALPLPFRAAGVWRRQTVRVSRWTRAGSTRAKVSRAGSAASRIRAWQSMTGTTVCLANHARQGNPGT